MELPVNPRLYSLEEAAKVLGGISPWTLRKHVQLKRVSVVKIGRRVFLNEETISHILENGLPSLAKAA